MDKKVVVLIDSGINKLDFCDCLVGGKHFYVEENYVCCDDSLMMIMVTVQHVHILLSLYFQKLNSISSKY